MDYPLIPGHADGSETSAAAAESVDAASIRRRILLEMADAPSTCEEIETRMGLRHQTASARIRELVMLGALHDSGQVRRNRSGRAAVVWTTVATVPTGEQLRLPMAAGEVSA